MARLEIMSVANAGKQCTSRRRANARHFHQALAAQISARRLLDQHFEFANAIIEKIQVRQQIAHCLLRIARQGLKHGLGIPANALRLERQYDAELAEQSAQPIDRRRSFLDY